MSKYLRHHFIVYRSYIRTFVDVVRKKVIDAERRPCFFLILLISVVDG